MQDVINTRQSKSTRTIIYADALHARREILDLDNFTIYNGEFNAQTGVLTVYSIDGAEIVFERYADEGGYFLRLGVCNILVAFRLFPSLQIALEEAFEGIQPFGEPITRSFLFEKTKTETKVIRTN